MTPHQWPLRTFVISILIVTTLTTIFVVGALILMIRIPMIEKEALAAARKEATGMVGRMELLLGGLEARLALVRDTLPRIPPEQREAFLDQAVQSAPAFKAISLVHRQGTIEAAGVGEELRAQRQDTQGSTCRPTPCSRR